MGRFDVLTQLDKKPFQSTPLPEKSEPMPPAPLPEDPLASKQASTQTDLHANMQTRKPVSLQTDKDANMQTSKQLSMQNRLPASLQTGKSAIIEKFSSYLTPACKRGLQRIAFETERKDYEVLIEAVEQYLERQQQQK